MSVVKLTAEAVEGLAPDAASVTAARKLARPAPWSETGYDERAVWGLCKGSGARPYQTQVDLSGPAWKCSCPSRKVPCKHGLALLLLHAAGEVSAGSPPAWVSEWLDSRAQRAARPARAPGGPPRGPRAAARRAAGRGGRGAGRGGGPRARPRGAGRGGLAAGGPRAWGGGEALPARPA